ncbi:OmpA family protein [uncultured Pseudacidovorax sp.]|uniref:OmpA family protein n=1 Tax=uncultured Pseudacidovorax sp. TaxID=679313 RepID=UPI0025E2267D|nr:OmpA family protein [uncultured Pseudacidovorax sp.]
MRTLCFFAPLFRSILPTVAGFLLLGASAAAQDLPGAKDNPLLKRFAGSTIVGYDFKRFDEYVVPTGTFKGYDTTSRKRSWASSVSVEGAVTRLWYESAGDTSTAELIRNYQNEVQAAGGSTLYDSGRDADFKSRSCFLCTYSWNEIKTSRSTYTFSTADVATARLASFRIPRPQGDLYVVVEAVQWAAPSKDYKAVKGAYAAVDVIEVGAMKQNMVTVSAGDMSKAIAATGRVALYGILFDTAKADIKPESKAALDEIAKLLKAEPALKLRVVGHTDNQGTLESNIALSKRRAEAVNAALVGQYAIAANRLAAYGVADLAPVASNAAEDGRAKNRRVELVPQ